MDAFHRTVKVGQHEDGDVWVEIEWTGERLSISGVVGPRRGGNCTGSAGQIDDVLGEKILGGLPAADIAELCSVWKRWHLNDMRAGTVAQEDFLRSLDYDRSVDGDHFDWAKRMLTHARLQPHGGYSYGSAWLREDVPEEVLAWLAALPDSAEFFPWS